MAKFEGVKHLNKETSELEINGKFALTEEELEQVTGGLQGETPINFLLLRQLLELLFAPVSENDQNANGEISNQTN